MFGALLADLSKAFDCLPHDIIIAKLNAYRFDMKALNFIYDYLRNQKQRTKIDNAYSYWQNILYGANASKCHVILCTDEHAQVKIGAA